MWCTVCIRDRHRFLVVKLGIALVAVKLEFVMVSDRPNQPLNGCALFGQNRQIAAPESKFIAL